MLKNCILSLFFLGVAEAQSSINLTANFDDLNEGVRGSIFSDGGILFSNIDERIPGTSVSRFCIQATTAQLPGFSPPNYLTFAGFVPGDTPNFAFGRFGSANIYFSGIGTFVSMNLMAFGTSSTNTLTLEGLMRGNIVDIDTITFYSISRGVVGRTIDIAGVFDSIRLLAAGPDNDGTVFFGVDNVDITVVPEPTVFGFSALGVSLIGLDALGRRLIAVLTMKRKDKCVIIHRRNCAAWYR
jgi:hypothetical protein